VHRGSHRVSSRLTYPVAHPSITKILDRMRISATTKAGATIQDHEVRVAKVSSLIATGKDTIAVSLSPRLSAADNWHNEVARIGMMELYCLPIDHKWCARCAIATMHHEHVQGRSFRRESRHEQPPSHHFVEMIFIAVDSEFDDQDHRQLCQRNILQS
jgi:hypothetical protein